MGAHASYMDRRLAAFLAVILLLPCAAVQADIKFSGSAYSETSLINSDGTIRYGNRNDLHLKATSRSEGARLVTELEFFTLYGYYLKLTVKF